MLESFEKFAPGNPTAREARDLARDPALRRMFDQALKVGNLRGAFQNNTFDAGVSGGMAFLVSELEKRDPKVREPLTSVTWMRDIIVKSGGGWVDFTSLMFVDYGISGPNFYGLSGTETTTIPVIQANLSKDVFRTFNWQNVLKVPFIDMQKLQNAGRSLEDMLDKGIKLNWNKTLDLVCYQGPFSSTAYPGLLNNPSIAATTVAAGAGGLKWSQKTPNEIMNDINTAMVSTWAASQYDTTGMANHILIPPAQFAYIVMTPVTAAGSASILTYLLDNNIGKSQGVDLKIFPSRWCVGAGSGATDRMMAYVNDEDKVYMDVTVPIQRVMTTPSIAEGGGAYLTLYAGQVGVVKFLYTQPAAYFDGL